MHEADVAKRYKRLFNQDSSSEMEDQFHAIAGEEFENVPPAMLAAFKEADAQAAAATSPVGSNLPLKQQEVDKICDSTIMDSLTLDEIILSCIFHYIENYCPGGGADESEQGFQTFLRDTAWKLGDVTWGWDMSPPPPPPATSTAFTELVANDPEGVELVREKLMELWAPLGYVMSQTQGANVGRENSPDGRGYGPIYYVSRYLASTAFLATEGYKDKDSLIARLVQARFSGHFRFACKAFVDWMDSEGVAAAGSQAPREARYSNPAEYGSPYDRNILLIASVLTAESHLQETDSVMTPSIHEWWEDNCVTPNLHRSALPKATVELDSEVYGVKDALGHQVPLVDYGPLLSYGSLRQLRDTVDAGRDLERGGLYAARRLGLRVRRRPRAAVGEQRAVHVHPPRLRPRVQVFDRARAGQPTLFDGRRDPRHFVGARAQVRHVRLQLRSGRVGRRPEADRRLRAAGRVPLRPRADVPQRGDVAACVRDLVRRPVGAPRLAPLDQPQDLADVAVQRECRPDVRRVQVPVRFEAAGKQPRGPAQHQKGRQVDGQAQHGPLAEQRL